MHVHYMWGSKFHKTKGLMVQMSADAITEISVPHSHP